MLEPSVTMTVKNRVTAWVAEIVDRRDNYRCIAPSIDSQAGWCRDMWGHVITRWPARHDPEKVSYCHVKDADAQSMGMKAPSDPDHLLLLCWGHHEGVGVRDRGGSVWGTSREGLEKQRLYLKANT